MAGWLFVCWLFTAHAVNVTSGGDALDDVELARVGGHVVYEPNAKKPWRYSRYYVKKKSTNYLAEAVVELRNTNLKAAAERKPKTVVVDQENFRFVPETTAIQAGDSVKFTNSDNLFHNIATTGKLATFNINMPKEGSYTHLFQRAGGAKRPVKIGCAIHGGMRAWIFVFDHPNFSVTGIEGEFMFEKIPPGKYDLSVVHSAGNMRWSKTIELKPGQELQIDAPLAYGKKRSTRSKTK